MFEVGKYYRVWTLDGTTPHEFDAGTVVEVHLPLVKFKGGSLNPGGETIINTASLQFVRAQEKSN
jgi:hypothetical protein